MRLELQAILHPSSTSLTYNVNIGGLEEGIDLIPDSHPCLRDNSDQFVGSRHRHLLLAVLHSVSELGVLLRLAAFH